MPLMQEVRSLFRRRTRTATIDIAGTQAERLGAPEIETSSGGNATSTIEIKTRGRLPVDPQRSQEEVLGLIRRIGDHLDGQTERTERVVGLMERLPQALEALPEIDRHNARLVETLHEHLGQTKRREEALNGTLGAMSEASSRQTEVLGLVQQHLDASSHVTATLSGTLETLQHSLHDLASSNGRTAEVLAAMSESASRRERELTTVIVRTQRWMIGAVCFCGAASILAMIVAAAALAQVG